MMYSKWPLALILSTASLFGAEDPPNKDVLGGKGYSLGTGKCDAADLAKIQPLVDQLMKDKDAANPFGPDAGLGLDVDQARAKVKEVRNNVKKMIELAKGRSDANRSKYLDDQFKAGNICVSWGLQAAGTNLIDDAPGKIASELTIMNIKTFLGGPMKCHDIYMIDGADTVAHENTHAGQSYAPDLPPNPTADQRRAANGMKYACNEIEAHGDAEDWYGLLKTALCDANLINPDVALPPNGLNDAVRSILESLRGIQNAVDRANEIAKLKKSAEYLEDWNLRARACYQVAKNAFNNFILGHIDKPTLKAILNHTKWKDFTGWLDHRAFVSKQPPNLLEQFSSDTGEGPDLFTPLQEIMDFEVIPIPNFNVTALLVIGQDQNGLGTMLAFLDTDGDALFEQNTMLMLFAGDPRVQANMDLFQNPDTGQYYVYDSMSLQMFELLDQNADGLPDQIGNQVTPHIPELVDYLQFEFARSAAVPTILAYDMVDSTNPAIVHDTETLVLEDQNSDGFFETVYPASFDQILLWPPTFEVGFFYPGATTMDLYGVPGANLEVWLTDPTGALLELRGSGVGQGIPLPDQVNLSQPFQPGDELVIVDTTNGLQSVNFEVPFDCPPPSQYCPANLNSTGLPAVLDMTGSSSLSANDFGLISQNAAPSSPGLFFYGPNQISAPFGEGIRCVGGQIFRLPPAVFTDGSGTATKSVDFSAPPVNSGPGEILPGSHWNFQFWFRDVSGGPSGFNLSGGLGVSFCP